MGAIEKIFTVLMTSLCAEGTATSERGSDIISGSAIHIAFSGDGGLCVQASLA